MKRYKMAAVWTNDGGQLLEHDEGDWVRYEDVQQLVDRHMNIQDKLAEDALTALHLAQRDAEIGRLRYEITCLDAKVERLTAECEALQDEVNYWRKRTGDEGPNFQDMADDPAHMPVGSGPFWNKDALVALLDRTIADRAALEHDYSPDTDPIVVNARRALEGL